MIFMSFEIIFKSSKPWQISLLVQAMITTILPITVEDSFKTHKYHSLKTLGTFKGKKKLLIKS